MADRDFEAKKRDFECLKCGTCCAVPGEVFLTQDEGKKIAALLGMDFNAFKAKHMKKVWRQFILNMPYSGGCVFWKDKKCTVYEARPEQCRTFPYWEELKSSHENWKEIEKYCKGAMKVK
ncbi:MAG: YkgJ family cysteine cluster protein [Candidatus Goldiibacteriota bacterium]|jgi:Fe-S-cluster containining protein